METLERDAWWGEKTGKGKVVRVGDAWYGIVQYFVLQ